jgi:hypothetical protein
MFDVAFVAGQQREANIMSFNPIKSLKEFFCGSDKGRVSLGLSTSVAPLGTSSEAKPAAPAPAPATKTP